MFKPAVGAAPGCDGLLPAWLPPLALWLVGLMPPRAAMQSCLSGSLAAQLILSVWQ